MSRVSVHAKSMPVIRNSTCCCHIVPKRTELGSPVNTLDLGPYIPLGAGSGDEKCPAFTVTGDHEGSMLADSHIFQVFLHVFFLVLPSFFCCLLAPSTFPRGYFSLSPPSLRPSPPSLPPSLPPPLSLFLSLCFRRMWRQSIFRLLVVTTSKEPVCPWVELILKIIIIFLGFIKSKPC